MSLITYTKEDMQRLKTMVNTGSVYEGILEDFDYDPVLFEAFVKKHVPKEYKILYETPVEELPMLMTDRSIQGLINFRFAIGK